MVIPAGFEPAIFWMRTRRPKPLDDGTKQTSIPPHTKVCTQGGLGAHLNYSTANLKVNTSVFWHGRYDGLPRR